MTEKYELTFNKIIEAESREDAEAEAAHIARETGLNSTEVNWLPEPEPEE